MVGASGYERIEQDWLLEILAVLPRPWPMGAALAWLRYCSRQIERGLPAWCPAVEGGRARELSAMPGRRLLAQVAGLAEWSAREALDGRSWVDPMGSQRPPMALPPAARGAPSRLPSSVREGRSQRVGASQSPPDAIPDTAQAPPVGIPYARGSSCTDTDTDTDTRTTRRSAPTLALLVELAGEVIGEAPPSEVKAATVPIRRLAVEAGLSDEELAEGLRLVARWARESVEPAAARAIRGIGLPGGVDRSASTATLCDTSRWAERIRWARAWHERKLAEKCGPSAPAAPMTAMERHFNEVVAAITLMGPRPVTAGLKASEQTAAEADAIAYMGDAGAAWAKEHACG
jgi:hypothetical protein